MVWGIMNPGIGEYGPSGEYTGWYESLNRYYEQMPPQEQAIYQTGQGNNDYNYYVSSKFNSMLR